MPVSSCVLTVCELDLRRRTQDGACHPSGGTSAVLFVWVSVTSVFLCETPSELRVGAYFAPPQALFNSDHVKRKIRSWRETDCEAVHRGTRTAAPLPPNTDQLSKAAYGLPTVVTRGRTRLSPHLTLLLMAPRSPEPAHRGPLPPVLQLTC